MLEQLKKIGISENEAKVYMALLDLGSATAQDISKKAGIPRPTVYVQLEDLKKIGLASTFEKEPTRKGGATKTMFRAESPEHLVRFVAHQKAAVSEKEELLKVMLPDLGKYFENAGERPKVRFFEGIEGLKTMQAETVKQFPKLKEILNITSLDAVFGIFPTLTEDYSSLRIKHGVHSRIIYSTKKAPFLKNTDQKMLRRSRFIPPEKFPYINDLGIIGNSVEFSVLKEKPFGIIIENEDIAESMRSFFNLAWEAAEKYNK